MFGAGYAGAADRLFLMDVLRHTGRAELASFLGGSPTPAPTPASGSSRPTPKPTWNSSGQAPQHYGASGPAGGRRRPRLRRGDQRLRRRAPTLDPKLKPGEYTLLGKPMEAVEADRRDRDGLADRRHLRQGRRQRAELGADHAGLRQAHRRKAPGAGPGSTSAPRTTPRRRRPSPSGSRTRPRSAFAKRGLALPDPGTVRHPERRERLGGVAGTRRRARRRRRPAARRRSSRRPRLQLGARLRRESATGHPIGVLGPQVGYYEPQILMEEDLHGPGIDARGATFPGVSLYVLLGHGRDYAWSATTRHLRQRRHLRRGPLPGQLPLPLPGRVPGRWRSSSGPNSWTPNGVDDTPAGSETLTAYRTVHGIVFARGKVGGSKVAFVLRAPPTSTRRTRRSSSRS